MRVRAHLAAVARHNARTLRSAPLRELSGALGDLGTLLPLMMAMALAGSIDLSATLVFSGLANMLTGAYFGVPLPVQPMKAIAAVAIAQRFSLQETAAAGLVMGAAVLLLSVSGLLAWLGRVVPVPVVKGIQVGAGLSLTISAGSTLVLPLSWLSPGWDNRMLAVAAFAVLVFATLLPRFPYALVIFIVGVIMAAVLLAHDAGAAVSAGLWHPRTVVPAAAAWRTGAVEAAIPQLPLTTLNSILAVTSLAASLFPSFPPAPSTTALGFSVAFANLLGCWFGAMPVCHGSGGLAGQYRFGARSGASIIALGAIKLLLGLFVGDAIVPLLQRFPKSLLGVMVLAAGVELAKVGQNVGHVPDLWDQAYRDSGQGEPVRPAASSKTREQESRDRWMIMLITATGCIAFKNDAVGFIAGLVWHWSLRLPGWIERVSDRSAFFRLQRERADEGESLLGANSDAPEGRLA